MEREVKKKLEEEAKSQENPKDEKPKRGRGRPKGSKDKKPRRKKGQKPETKEEEITVEVESTEPEPQEPKKVEIVKDNTKEQEEALEQFLKFAQTQEESSKPLEPNEIRDFTDQADRVITTVEKEPSDIEEQFKQEMSEREKQERVKDLVRVGARPTMTDIPEPTDAGAIIARSLSPQMGSSAKFIRESQGDTDIRLFSVVEKPEVTPLAILKYLSKRNTFWKGWVDENLHIRVSVSGLGARRAIEMQRASSGLPPSEEEDTRGWVARNITQRRKPRGELE